MKPRMALLLVLMLLGGLPTLARQTRTSAAQPSTDQVIQKFAEAESRNRTARNNYTFTQDFDLVTVGEAGSVTGRFKRVSDIVFDDRGNRIERITYFPPTTLTAISVSPEDMQDLAGVQPFALATEDLAKYQIDYHGKEKIDELNTYVFDVKPKQFRPGERYLQGRIWVDDHDLQIVKVAGQAVPEVKNQAFPHFESYRENIDERYWFPTYIYADDVLDFKRGPSVHIKMVVKFTNYKKFTGRIRLGDEGEAATDEETKTGDKKPPVKPPEEEKPALKRKKP
jgi:hypothetical protein